MPGPDTGVEQPFGRLAGLVTHRDYAPPGSGAAAWRAGGPRHRGGPHPSTADDHQQPAMWLPPSGEGDRPLLLVVHSWSTDYTQGTGIPFALFAEHHGWAMIHPDFRGPYRNAQATDSDLAVQDILDALDFAIAQGGVDADRVYLTGFSGGGMMTLLMAGRHPERFAAAAARVPIHDLVHWYRYNVAEGTRYAAEIRASCGGDPTGNDAATLQCLHRSPTNHLQYAVEAGVPVYIGHGLSDTIVPPVHALWAFNQLVEPADRVDQAALEAADRRTLPSELRGRVEAETYFAPEDPEVFFARSSGPVTVVLFDGGHEVVNHPALQWFHELAGRS
jgi:dienelactone hydrolase